VPTALDEFFGRHDWDLLHRTNGWKVSRDGDLVLLVLRARDGEVYRVSFVCDGYPDKAPSAFFVNAAGSQDEKAAWPKGTDEFMGSVKPPPASFICMPLTREGLGHHNDWYGKPGAWDSKKSLLDLFNYFGRLLGSSGYLGRGP
jgi:hypothetical protein